MISQYRIYAERTWYEDGIKYQKEYELGQSSNISPVSFPDSYFLEYPENYNYKLYSSFAYPNSSQSGVSGYNPGALYLPKNYFTIHDMFSSEELSNFVSAIPAGMEILEYPDYNRNINQVLVPKKIFWENPDGIKLIPALKCTYALKSRAGEKLYSMQITFHFIMTSLAQDTVSFSNGWYAKTDDGKSIKLSDSYNGYGSVSGAPIYGNGVSNRNINRYDMFRLSECVAGLTRFFNMLLPTKWYPFFHVITVDRLLYEGSYYHAVAAPSRPPVLYNVKYTGSNNPGIGFLIDLSNSPNYPAQCFVCAGEFICLLTKNTSSGFITRITDEGGPDPSDPLDKDDPNDEDPGGGGGANPGDEGGDGDHDNTSDDIKKPPIPPLSGSGVGIFTIFNPSFSELNQLATKLWDPSALEAIKQYFTNPMDTIIGLGIIPVQPNTGERRNIALGMYDTGVSSLMVDSDYVIKDCGSVAITRYYGSYLDYDPYTKIKLYLPYVGEIDISPDEVMTKSLGVIYYINVVTGNCVAFVTADDSIIYTVSGNCIRQLPLAQNDYSAIINTAVSAAATIATAGVNASAASSVGAAVAGQAKTDAGKKLAETRTSSQLETGAVGAGASLIGQVMQSKMRYNHAGQMGTGAGQLTYQKPYLTIERPNLDLATNYKSYVGYPCNKTLQLIRCNGFTQVETCKLSVPGATDGEVSEILSYLVEGVII